MEVSRCAQACKFCRLRKVRCDGNRPCGNCQDHHLQCIVLPSQRPKKYRTRPPMQVLGQRLTDLEALLSSMNASRVDGTRAAPYSNLAAVHPPHPASEAHSSTTGSEVSAHQSVNPILDLETRSQAGWPDLATDDTGIAHNSLSVSESANPKTMSLLGSQSSPPSTPDTWAVISGASRRPPKDLLSIPLDRKQSAINFHDPRPRRSVDEVAAAHARVTNTMGVPDTGNHPWEYYDAGSWLAVCSSQGLRWVTERTGEPEFPEQAKDLSVKWLKRLHRQQARHASRMPEPDQATAWKYAQAFFAEDFGRFVCVVPPAEFKCKLSLHFEGRLGHAPDPAWYALRHTVYASGCRILLSKDPTGTFSDAQAQSWKYFENAMAVHLELLYSRTDVHTVRALVAMTQYLEHSGDPSLSYIMCGNAARLAQSIGLHRRPDNSRSLHHDGNHQDASDDEAVVKTWLFWAIYALDKFISQRLGRPSAIDDKTITCGIPLRRPENSMLDLGFCTQMIKLGRIRSCITQSIFDTPSELYDGSSSVVALIARLSEDLRRWRHDYIRSIVEAHTSSTGCQAPAQPCVGRLQRLSLELGYQSAIIHLHSAFALPWLEEGFTNSERGVSSAASVAHQALRAISSHAVSKASRCIIETVCQLTFEGSTPRWMVFQCPMLGVINLFISILKNPRAYEVQGDLSLLDAAAQHFDRLRERSDTQLSFTFAHEIAALARRTIRRVDAMSTREGNLVWDTTENDRSRRQDQRRAIDGWEDTTMLQNHANGKAPFQEAALAAMPWDWSTAIDSVDGFDMEQWEMFVNAPPCNDVSSFHSTTHATENALKTSLF